jgi:hypothetical protein
MLRDEQLIGMFNPRHLDPHKLGCHDDSVDTVAAEPIYLLDTRKAGPVRREVRNITANLAIATAALDTANHPAIRQRLALHGYPGLAEDARGFESAKYRCGKRKSGEFFGHDVSHATAGVATPSA